MMSSLKQYAVYYRVYGELVHSYLAYFDYTKGGKENLNHEISQSLLAASNKPENTLINMWSDIQTDFTSGVLAKDKYQRFLRYYQLIVNDTCILAPKIKAHIEILAAIKTLK
jgi:hypothetical protein